MSLEMKSDREGVTEDGVPVPVGTVCTYLGHVLGGMVRVRFQDGTEGVVHPHIFPDLR